jgi:response regulator of citrate/malate metabolism
MNTQAQQTSTATAPVASKAKRVPPKRALPKKAKTQRAKAKEQPKKDKFGLRVASKESQAAHIYYKTGATTEEIRTKLGSAHLNVLKNETLLENYKVVVEEGTHYSKRGRPLKFYKIVDKK